MGGLHTTPDTRAPRGTLGTLNTRPPCGTHGTLDIHGSLYGHDRLCQLPLPRRLRDMRVGNTVEALDNQRFVRATFDVLNRKRFQTVFPSMESHITDNANNHRAG